MAIQPVDPPAFHPRGTLIAGALGRPLRRATWAGSIVTGGIAVGLAALLGDRGLWGSLAAAGVGMLAGLGAGLATWAASRKGPSTRTP